MNRLPVKPPAPVRQSGTHIIGRLLSPRHVLALLSLLETVLLETIFSLATKCNILGY